MKKKHDGNYTRMPRAILNKSLRQHPQNSNCTTTYHPSRKLSKLDKPDMLDAAGEVRTNSFTTYSCRPLHRNEQRQDDRPGTYIQQFCAHTGYSSSRERWMIETGGERGSRRSVLAAWHDDDDLFIIKVLSLTQTYTCTHIHARIYIYIYTTCIR